MRQIVTFLLTAALTLSAADSLVLTDGDSLTYTTPAGSPWTALGSRRLEMAVDLSNWDTTGNSGTNLWQFGSEMRLQGDAGNPSHLCVSTNASSASGQQACIDAAGRGMVLLRAQVNYRDANGIVQAGTNTAQQFIEIWDLDGGNYEAAHGPASDAATSQNAASASQIVGGSQSTATILWVKQYSTVVEPGRLSPVPRAHGNGDMGDWDFDGQTLNDASSYGMDLSGSGYSFSTTPAIDPVPDAATDSGEKNWMPAPVVRAGATVTLFGSCASFAVTDGCTCAWSDKTGAGDPEDSILFTGSTSSCTTTAVFPTEGQYTARLQVTDQDESVAARDFIVGAVATDDNDNIVIPDPDIQWILGPSFSTRLGSIASPWEWYDERHVVLADFFGDHWEPNNWDSAPRLGYDLTVSNGSDQLTCTGGGCSLQTDLCAGGSAPSLGGGSVFVVVDEQGLYWRWNIGSCESETAVTMTQIWNRTGSTAMQAFVWEDAAAWWATSGNNTPTFYDGGLAQYALYLRTGLTKYYDYFDEFESNWWTNPIINKGYCHDGPISGSQCPVSWNQALTGLYLWTVDQDARADNLPGLYDFVEDNDGYCSLANSYGPTSNARDEGYQMWWMNLQNYLDSDPGHDAALEAMRNRYTTNTPATKNGCFNPDYFVSKTLGYRMVWNQFKTEGTGTVYVTNGDTVVTCADTCSFDGSLVGRYLSTKTPGITNDRWTDGQGVKIASVESPSSLTLESTWTGATHAAGTDGAASWISTTQGSDVAQPFMSQFPGMGYHWEYKAGGTDHRQAVVDLARFNCTNGYDYQPEGDAIGGMLNRYNAAGCAVSIEADIGNSDCQYANSSTDNPASNRYLWGEQMGVLSVGYAYSKDVDPAESEGLLACGDLAMGEAYGKWGGPRADYDGILHNNYYANEIDDRQITFTDDGGNGKDKGFAFHFGAGQTWRWLSERQGGTAAEHLVSYSVPLDISGVAGASKADVTLFEPKGTVSRHSTDQAGAFAPVLGDKRQGQHLAMIEYRSDVGTLIETQFEPVSPPGGPPVTISGSGSLRGDVSF